MAYSELFSEQRPCGNRAQTDEYTRLNQRYFGIQPRPAGRNLPSVRALVDPLLPFWSPFEVFHDVGDIGVTALDPDFSERLIEQLPSRSDKWPASAVFLVAWLFPNEHHLCPLLALTEDGLGAGAPQIAGLARGRRLTHPGKRWVLRDQIGGRAHD
jgi:hypothetical protein